MPSFAPGHTPPSAVTATCLVPETCCSQYDNAQRLAETGFGAGLPTYDWSEEELVGTAERLLADDGLRVRMGAIAADIRSRPGEVKGADLIERLALTGQPVLS